MQHNASPPVRRTLPTRLPGNGRVQQAYSPNSQDKCGTNRSQLYTSAAPTTPKMPAATATASRSGGGVGRAAAAPPCCATALVTTAKVVAVGNTLVISTQLVDPCAGVRQVVPANVPKSTAVAV